MKTNGPAEISPAPWEASRDRSSFRDCRELNSSKRDAPFLSSIRRGEAQQVRTTGNLSKKRKSGAS